MTISSVRSGRAIRPRTTVTLSVVKYPPFGLPSKAGGACPGTPVPLFCPSTCKVPSNPVTVMARVTPGTRATALLTCAE